MNIIFIADFTYDDRDKLLKCLWDNSIIYTSFNKPEFNIDIAKKQIELDNGFADNICGKIIGVQIYGNNTIDAYEYDTYNGIGLIKEIIENIREQKFIEDIDEYEKIDEYNIDSLITKMEI